MSDHVWRSPAARRPENEYTVSVGKSNRDQPHPRKSGLYGITEEVLQLADSVIGFKVPKADELRSDALLGPNP